jgi:hypothetical protein
MLILNMAFELHSDVQASAAPKRSLEDIVGCEAFSINVRILGSPATQHYPEPSCRHWQLSEHEKFELPDALLCGALYNYLEVAIRVALHTSRDAQRPQVLRG